MTKKKRYRSVRFNAEVLREAKELRHAIAGGVEKSQPTQWLMVQHEEEVRWDYDAEEEFFADYWRFNKKAQFILRGDLVRLDVWAYSRHTDVTVRGTSRSDIERIFTVFERSVESSRLPDLEPV